MAALFEMHIRVGGDPRGFIEFAALRSELAKLSHPACPDVDWAKVEQLCLALFQENGAEMHTACFYTLALGQRQGLEGIIQGVALLEALSVEWARLWPAIPSARLDLLGWLFDQLQPLLRSMAMTVNSLPSLVQLDTELEGLETRLLPQLSSHQLTLQALRHLVSSLILRQEQSQPSRAIAQVPVRVLPSALVTPVVILPPSAVEPRRPRMALWLFVGTLIVSLLAGVSWWVWMVGQDKQPLMPEPVRLDSLSLFDAGSSELKLGSNRLLINALIKIKAKPGWLIVIAGHSDATGSVEQNLALSHARASAVRDWMQQMGDIADSCFAVQGFAASQPTASNESEAGRTANRRVDIQLVPEAGACEQSASVGLSNE